MCIQIFVGIYFFANFANQRAFAKMKTQKFVLIQYKFAAAGRHLLSVGRSQNIHPAVQKIVRIYMVASIIHVHTYTEYGSIGCINWQ